MDKLERKALVMVLKALAWMIERMTWGGVPQRPFTASDFADQMMALAHEMEKEDDDGLHEG